MKNGIHIVGEYKATYTFNWQDPATNTPKPIISYSVLVPHSDGTISKESITVPAQQRPADLVPGQVYVFPVTARVNKKRLLINWDARSDSAPFPVSKLQSDFGLED